MIADNGLEKASKMDAGIANGINIYGGKCTNKNVALAVDVEYTALCEVIA